MSQKTMPAFPTPETNGMDLRDYFAGQALQGLLASGLRERIENDRLARWSYDQADAMLEARGR